mgnify:CR=1 FL=1
MKNNQKENALTICNNCKWHDNQQKYPGPLNSEIFEFFCLNPTFSRSGFVVDLTSGRKKFIPSHEFDIKSTNGELQLSPHPWCKNLNFGKCIGYKKRNFWDELHKKIMKFFDR